VSLIQVAHVVGISFQFVSLVSIEEIQRRASISKSTYFFFLQYFLLEYSFNIAAAFSFLYFSSQIVLKSNGRDEELSIFNLQYDV
jgi:hypothetical protein